jgi:uncharacterized protein (DUF433 family)/DNA-binding transcriptional MerR regulator
LDPRSSLQEENMTDYQGFYTTSHVSRLTGIPTSTLYDWRERGIIRPSLQIMEGDKVSAEGYSYADLTLIRILKALRDKKLNFDDVGNTLHHLYERLGPPNKGWAKEHVYVEGGHIYVDRPDYWEVTADAGQKVAEVMFGDLFDELRDLEEGASLIVPTQFRNDVQIDPLVMGGEPVIRGTRLPTATVATMLGRYKSIDKLAKLYRTIPRDKIARAIEYERYLDERIA